MANICSGFVRLKHETNWQGDKWPQIVYVASYMYTPIGSEIATCIQPQAQSCMVIQPHDSLGLTNAQGWQWKMATLVTSTSNMDHCEIVQLVALFNRTAKNEQMLALHNMRHCLVLIFQILRSGEHYVETLDFLMCCSYNCRGVNDWNLAKHASGPSQ